MQELKEIIEESFSVLAEFATHSSISAKSFCFCGEYCARHSFHGILQEDILSDFQYRIFMVKQLMSNKTRLKKLSVSRSRVGSHLGEALVLLLKVYLAPILTIG